MRKHRSQQKDFQIENTYITKRKETVEYTSDDDET